MSALHFEAGCRYDTERKYIFAGTVIRRIETHVEADTEKG